MKLLLDTHAFMWWHSEPEYIPQSILTLLQDANHEVILSVVSLWEMQIKIQLGKLTLRDDLELMLKPHLKRLLKQVEGYFPQDHLVKRSHREANPS